MTPFINCQQSRVLDFLEKQISSMQDENIKKDVLGLYVDLCKGFMATEKEVWQSNSQMGVDNYKANLDYQNKTQVNNVELQKTFNSSSSVASTPYFIQNT
ncbi:hypothetical protein G6W42_08120 [Campylobacter concisus]|jgi:hypothetical protein|uniref:hypothetical protein n=1 Tax=Campylobacter concisus TaxID=199 RepID=UPI0018838E04|nr:hypothetical protein [Campylobacter concisus]MBE9852580.1 hypothetical protein [Campylobacter concisus]